MEVEPVSIPMFTDWHVSNAMPNLKAIRERRYDMIMRWHRKYGLSRVLRLSLGEIPYDDEPNPSPAGW